MAVAALRGDRTMSEIAAAFGVHPVQIAQWKKRALAALYEELERLKVELDWLKRKHEWSTAERRAAVDPIHPNLSIARRCALLGIPRSSFYYRPHPVRSVKLSLMRVLSAVIQNSPISG